MSKELDALNKIKKIEIYKEEDYYDPDDERTIGLSDYEYQGSVEEEYANEIELIETELKEKAKLEIYASTLENVLRIIKEKGLEQNEILLIKENDFADYMAVMTQLYWGDETLSKKLKTQAEFDLLKERLKW